MKLRKERNERIRRRLIVAGTLLGLVVLGAVILVGLAVADVITLPPVWTGWLLVLAVVLVLGYVGRPVGKPLVQPAVLLAGVHEPLRAPHVMKALCTLGIGGMRDPEQIGLLFDVAREGPGYQVDLELPAGVPASAVLSRRSQLSAVLRRELGTVWPSVGKRHEGHLVLYVADQPMTGAKQPRWPLLKAGEVDLFRPVPMFTDQQGRWVHLTLAYANFVIGALPRMGKTFLLRQALRPPRSCGKCCEPCAPTGSRDVNILSHFRPDTYFYVVELPLKVDR